MGCGLRKFRIAEDVEDGDGQVRLHFEEGEMALHPVDVEGVGAAVAIGVGHGCSFYAHSAIGGGEVDSLGVSVFQEKLFGGAESRVGLCNAMNRYRFYDRSEY
jgi:hypothetical protein